jgi:hypothetical protein
MSLSVISEVWDALRNHIDLHERSDAAETLVNYMIDNNFEPDDIKDSFRGDKEIATALKYYADQLGEEEEYEDYDEDEEDY